MKDNNTVIVKTITNKTGDNIGNNDINTYITSIINADSNTSIISDNNTQKIYICSTKSPNLTNKQKNKEAPTKIANKKKKKKKHQGEPDEKGIRPKLSIKTECKERKDHLANNPLVFQRQ